MYIKLQIAQVPDNPRIINFTNFVARGVPYATVDCTTIDDAYKGIPPEFADNRANLACILEPNDIALSKTLRDALATGSARMGLTTITGTMHDGFATLVISNAPTADQALEVLGDILQEAK